MQSLRDLRFQNFPEITQAWVAFWCPKKTLLLGEPSIPACMPLKGACSTTQRHTAPKAPGLATESKLGNKNRLENAFREKRRSQCGSHTLHQETKGRNQCPLHYLFSERLDHEDRGSSSMKMRRDSTISIPMQIASRVLGLLKSHSSRHIFEKTAAPAFTPRHSPAGTAGTCSAIPVPPCPS